MGTVNLDFDNEAKVSFSFFEHNYYEKVFHVQKDGVDYNWSGVTEMILQVKAKPNSTVKILELKLSAADFVLTTGYMTMKLPTTKTNITPGEYNSVVLLLTFTGAKPRVWWAGGTCKVKTRDIGV